MQAVWALLLPLACAAGTNVFNTSTDAAQCICDLTKATCDAFCCCDSDCDDTQIDLWDKGDSNLNRCKPEKLTTWGRKACVKRNKIYMDSAIKGMTVIHDTIDQLFCIEEDNSYEEDYFFTDIGDVPGETIATREEEVLDYVDILYAPTRNETVGSTFLPGDFLISFINSKQQLDYKWPLPSPDPYGHCSDMNGVKWLVNQDLPPCTRSTWICKGPLDPSSFEGITIANTPQIGISQDVIKVERGVVRQLMSDGTLKVVQPGTNIISVGGNCQCSNILYEAHYTVVTDPTSTKIVSISVDMVLGDANSCDIQQRFSVRFQSAAVFQELSGNPGYLPSKPILFKSDSSATELETLSFGGVAADGSCVPGIAGNDTAEYLRNAPIIASRTEMIFSCYHSFTLSELADYCKPTGKNHNSLIFNYLNLPQYVAKFGKVNITNPDDFVELVLEASHPTQSFSDPTCRLENTLVLEFITAEEGSVSNPQTKIVFARAYFLSNM